MPNDAAIIKNISVTGNRTPVSRVTGGDTYHYTITDYECKMITLDLLTNVLPVSCIDSLYWG